DSPFKRARRQRPFANKRPEGERGAAFHIRPPVVFSQLEIWSENGRDWIADADSQRDLRVVGRPEVSFNSGLTAVGAGVARGAQPAERQDVWIQWAVLARLGRQQLQVRCQIYSGGRKQSRLDDARLVVLSDLPKCIRHICKKHHGAENDST